MNATTTKPGNNPATKTPAKKAAPKMSGGLTYPSPLLGVPNPATTSRSIEIVFDGRTKTKRGILATERQRLQIAAAGKIVAMAAEERRERAESATTYKGDVDAAERAYMIAVRAAQSARDIALANAKEDRNIRTAQSEQAFSAATEPVERDLKSSIYMLDTAADEELSTLAEEFRIYHAAAVANEAEKKAAADAEAAKKVAADLAAKPGLPETEGGIEASMTVDSDALLRPEQKEALAMLAPRKAPKKAAKKTATKAPVETV